MLFLMWLLWIIFNGRITLEIALIGLVMTGAVYFFSCRYLHYSLKAERVFLRRLPMLAGYYLLLVWEIAKANIELMRVLFHPEKEIRPCLVSFEGTARTAWGRAAIADSITLTPGTITVNLEKNTYTVHCLDERFSEGLSDSIFVNRILAIEEVSRRGA